MANGPSRIPLSVVSVGFHGAAIGNNLGTLLFACQQSSQRTLHLAVRVGQAAEKEVCRGLKRDIHLR